MPRKRPDSEAITSSESPAKKAKPAKSLGTRGLREEIRARDRVELADEDLVRLSQLVGQYVVEHQEKFDYEKLADMVCARLAPLLADSRGAIQLPPMASSSSASSTADTFPAVEEDTSEELSREELSSEETSSIEKQRLAWRDLLRPSEKGQPVFSLLQTPMRFPSKYQRSMYWRRVLIVIYTYRFSFSM
jgi:hypothetical protein